MATVNQFNREFVNTPLGFPITDSEVFPVNTSSAAAKAWLELMSQETTEDTNDE